MLAGVRVFFYFSKLLILALFLLSFWYNLGKNWMVNYLIKILSDYQVAITLIISISGFFIPL